MGDPTAEVEIKLVVDDQSASTLEKVKAGLHDTGDEAKVTQQLLTSIDANIAALVEHTHKAAGEQGNMAAEVAKGNVEFELMKKSVEVVGEGIKIAYEFTEKLVDASLEAAEGQEKQEKQMAGFLYLMDQGKHSMAELRDYTSMQREEFEGFAATAGVATGDVVKAYDKLIEKGTMASEKAAELAKDMAIVGQVVPGGMQGLAQGISGVEMGMVRARNPIVQLIAATHVLKGNATDVAKQMKKMSPEKQMELATEAIAKQAEQLKKMGAITPDMEHLRASFGDVKESFLEALGNPMMARLVPELVRLRDFLIAHMEEIKAFGQKLGDMAADVITYVSTALEGIYEGITTNWDGFKSTLNEIFGDWKAMWEMARGDSAHIKNDFADIGIALQAIFVGIAKVVHEIGDELMTANDLLHGRTTGYSQTMAAGHQLAQAAQSPGLSKKEFEDAVGKFRTEATSRGAEGKNQIEGDIDSMRAKRADFDAAGVNDKTDVMNQDWAKVNDTLQYNVANHQQGLTEYQISLIAGSKEASAALLEGKIHIATGMDEFIKMLAEKAPQLAAQLRDAGNVVAKQGGIKPQGPVQNFYGGVHVKQDFKDQDPDRILLTFKKGLAGAANSRTSSKLGTPFGF